MNNFLSLYLDGPMQSWGYMSKFDQRTSLAYPTKSGICGMICAAKGIDRSDKLKLAEIASLQMTVYVLSPPGRMKDFHTVGGGFDKGKSLYEKQSIVKKADGATGNTVVTRREYLLDAKFAVVLYGKTNLLSEIETALRNPKWGIWLGRKSCIPAVPVFQGCFDTPEAALESAKCAFKKTYEKDCEIRRTITEVANFADGSDSIMDTPQDFAKREFTLRRVCVE